MNDRLDDLLHREIDGALSDAEQAELAERAAADPAVARARDELKRLDGLLRRVPVEEPPADLRRDIMAALPREAASAGWLETLRGVLAGPRMLAYAGAAAAVLVLAFFGGEFMKPVTGPDANGDLTGTLAPLTPAGPDFTEAILDHDRLTGSLQLTRQGSAVSLDVAVRPTAPVDLHLRWNQGRLILGGVAPAGTEFTAGEPGALVLKGLEPTDEPLSVAFATVGKNAERTVHFEFVADGTTLGTGELTLPAADPATAKDGKER